MVDKTLDAVTVALHNGFSSSQSFTGDGTTREFIVTDKPEKLASVSVGGVVKTENTDYSYSASTGKITFVSAPANKAVIESAYDFYHYYVETVKQELKPPCFTVDMLNPMSRSTNKVHYYRTMPVVVHYFAGDRTDLKKHCYAIGEQALMALEYITIENRLVRGEGMEMTMVDDVLQLFITYGYWTNISTDETETMLTETLIETVQ